MSGQALVWAANVRGLKPTTKIVLIQLAERHNKDTKLCNPSIKTLADDCEMDRSTVIRHLEILEGLDLITRSRRGNEDGGRTSNEYVLHMPEPTKTDVSDRVKSQIATGVKSQNGGGLSRKNGGVKSHSCATLTCKEPDSEPSLFGSKEPHSDLSAKDLPTEDRFEEFWKAFPTGRKTDKPKAKTLFDRIIAGKHKGIPKTSADVMIGAAKRYAASQPDPQFVPLPTTWLNGARWDQWPEAPKAKKYDPREFENFVR